MVQVQAFCTRYRFLSIVLLLIGAWFLVSCSSVLIPKVRFINHGGYVPSRVSPYQGQVITLQHFPEESNYELIGYLQAESHVLKVHPDALVLRELKSAAARYGANAIVLHEGKLFEDEFHKRADLMWFSNIEPFSSPSTTTVVAIKIFPNTVNETVLQQDLHFKELGIK